MNHVGDQVVSCDMQSSSESCTANLPRGVSHPGVEMPPETWSAQRCCMYRDEC